MKLLEINAKSTKLLFHQVPYVIYTNDANWIAPLHKDIDRIFDPQKNRTFESGSAIRWVLLNSHDQPIGRIAAFVDWRKAKKQVQPMGNIGFFECIHNQEAANMLFSMALNWLKQLGLTAMNGPVSFGEQYNYNGLLTVGFVPPSVGMNYHKPYYPELFLNFGFVQERKRHAYFLNIAERIPERIWRIGKWVIKKEELIFKPFRYKDRKLFADDLAEVHNATWQVQLNDFVPTDAKTVCAHLAHIKPVIEEEFIWFAYHKKKPVAFVVMVPDINPILKKHKGKLDLIALINLLSFKQKQQINRARVLMLGISAGFQRHGIEAALFLHLKQAMKKRPHYKWIELSLVDDHHESLISFYQSIGAQHEKTYETYSYTFKEQEAEQKDDITSKKPQATHIG